MIHRIVITTAISSVLLIAQIPDFRPPTPLFGAVLRNDTQAVKEVLASGVSPNEGRFFGNPPMVLAIMNGNQSAVQAMLEHGADPKLLDRHGSSMLMWAAGGERPSSAVVDLLLKRGADPNVQNTLGETALTWAMRRGDMKIVEQLKAAGASDSQAVRQSVERAVALLQKSSPEFIKVSGCTSCHHQSLPQMLYSVARSRGYKVDDDAAAKDIKALLAMVKPMREGLENGKVNLPNPGISISYTLLGMEAESYAPDEYTAALAKAVVRTQAPDGHFAILPARPPLEASPFTSTALSIRALQVYGQNNAEQIARGVQWLIAAKPNTQEERTMKLLGLNWGAADRSEIDRAAAELIAQQQADGGWAQLNGLESDAYATGQAMVALYQAAALKPTDSAYQRGAAFLLRTQMPDGSWLVRTRSSPVQALKDSGFPHGRHQWISAAGTSWAAMALAYSQPKATVHESGGMF
ncbi:MAG TPA: ankyrin repeat domain-containing protein [Bryobacteraceae bacterium]|nr:ankyrin repeat domain-containing protein [Bryobacteraceae bacterium]